MATAETKIQWTDRTWNPVRGCARVSAGCENCYAERVAHRFSGKGQPYEGLTVLGKKGVRWAGEARFIPSALGEPLRWRKPQRIFVNSMSDLFHSDVTNEQIAAVFGVMAACPQHTFQCLTKRPERMVEWFRWVDEQARNTAPAEPENDWWRVLVCATHAPFAGTSSRQAPFGGARWPLPNVHLGVSCENQETANKRIPLLLQTPAAIRFISAAPLLGPIDLTEALTEARGLDWVIVGGESGSGARPCNSRWISDIVEQCRRWWTACFVKQLGARSFGHSAIRLKDKKGGDITEWPAELQVRQMP
jgi:protein gp37